MSLASQHLRRNRERKRAPVMEKGRNQVLERLAAGAPLDEVLSILVATTEEIRPEMLCSVLLLDKERKLLRHAAAPSLPDFYNEAIDGLEIGPSVGSCGAAADAGERVIVEDVMSHPNWAEFRELAEKAGLRACWSQPILSSTNDVLGTLAVYYREPRAPDQADLALIESAAHLAGIAIERKQTEEALRESEERYRTIASNVPGAIFRRVLKPDGTIQFSFLSEAYSNIFGQDPQELMTDASMFREHIHPEDYERWLEALRRSAEILEKQDIELRILTPGDGTKWVRSLSQPRRLENGDVVWDGVAFDITERKRTEEALREAQDELEARVEERTSEFRAVNAQLLEEIAERKRVEKALQENEARYRTLFKSAPIAIREENFSKVKAHIDALNIKKSKDFVAYLDRHPEFVAECGELIVEVDANEESLKLHNISDKRKFLATFTRNFSDQALRSLKDVLVAVHDGETNLEFETFVVRADGSRRDVTARWSVAPGYEDTYSRILFTSVDVTERKRAEEALRKAHAELERRVEERTSELRAVNAQLLDEIGERKQTEKALRESEASLANAQRIARMGNWEWNVEIDEVRRSAEMYRILGMTRKELDTGHEAFRRRVHPGDREAVDSAIDALLKKREPFNLQFRIVLPDGGVRIVHEHGEVTLDDAGTPVLVAGTTQDITERMQTQAQLIQASKLATLGEMATAMAHELNQPLNVIRMAADNVIERVTEGELDAQYLLGKYERISAQTERAAAIIDHMQIFGRKADEKPEYVDPREVIEQALGLVREQLRLQRIEVETVFPDHCRKILGHSVQLEQVLVDMISNARDAIEANRRSPGDPRKISLVVEDTGPHDKIKMVVKDTGGGIPENVIPRIFEPFFTTKEVGKGTGLGLSIAYGIVTEMGGTLEATNAEDGAEITITMPVAGERNEAA